jgi:hypothetical protein
MSADLLARLIEAGTPASLVGEVAMELGRLQAERNAAETADRRTPSAVKQQRYRDRIKDGEVTNGNDVTKSVTRDAEGNAGPTLDKESVPQTPLKEINPTQGVCIASAREADPVSVPAHAKIAANRIAIAVWVAILTENRESYLLETSVVRWNEMALRTGLATAKSLTPERRKRLRARLTEHGPDAFTEAIAAIERSPFCLGDSREGWRADFDFLLQASSFTKLIEGSYDRSSRGAQSGHRFANDRDSGPISPMVAAGIAREARFAGE